MMVVLLILLFIIPRIINGIIGFGYSMMVTRLFLSTAIYEIINGINWNIVDHAIYLCPPSYRELLMKSIDNIMNI